MMSVKGLRKLAICIIVFMFFAPIVIAFSAAATEPSPRLEFHVSDSGFYYIGSISQSRRWRLDEIRMSLYDGNKNLIETGLLSEYAVNQDFGYFLGYEDNNKNNRVDAADRFYVYRNEQVEPYWGIVLICEKSGRTLTGSTISGKSFSIAEEDELDEIDRKLLIRYSVLILMIINLLIILGVVYKMPCN